MKVETGDFLRLVEKAKTLVSWDLEATGLRGDYNSILVVSCKPFGSVPVSFKVEQPGNDKKVVREVSDYLASADCWVTYYGKGYDVPMLQTRLLKWGLPELVKRPHIDLYYTLKYSLNTARRSQAHILEWLEAPEAKLTVSADMWNKILYDFAPAMKTMVKRCESDAANTEALYKRTKHLIKDIKR